MMKSMAFLAAILLSFTTLWAEPEKEDKGNGLPFSITLSDDMPTGYYFRGDRYIGSGFINQPFVQLTLNPIKLGDWSLSPYVGVWANFAQDGHASNNRNWKHWTELDPMPGVDIKNSKFDRFDLNILYIIYTYPSGFKPYGSEFRYGQELDFTLSYDDSQRNAEGEAVQSNNSFGSFAVGQLTPIALNPHVQLGYSTYTAARIHYTYVEAGIAPKVSINDKLDLTFPVTVGFSGNRYYTDANGHNDLFGYGSVGVTANYAFDKHWSVHAGVQYMNLWSNLLRVDNGGGANAVVGNVGVTFAY